jgi:hypothetical protein
MAHSIRQLGQLGFAVDELLDALQASSAHSDECSGFAYVLIELFCQACRLHCIQNVSQAMGSEFNMRSVTRPRFLLPSGFCFRRSLSRDLLCHEHSLY